MAIPAPLWIPFAMLRIAASLFSMNSLLGTAFFLLILWVILRVALAVTGVFLHVLWIIAIVLAVFWLIGKFRST